MQTDIILRLSKPNCKRKTNDFGRNRMTTAIARSEIFKTMAPAPGIYIFHSILCYYDYNMYGEGVLPAKLCLLSKAYCSQLDIFRLQHVQIVNQTSCF